MPCLHRAGRGLATHTQGFTLGRALQLPGFPAGRSIAADDHVCPGTGAGLEEQVKLQRSVELCGLLSWPLETRSWRSARRKEIQALHMQSCNPTWLLAFFLSCPAFFPLALLQGWSLSQLGYAPCKKSQHLAQSFPLCPLNPFESCLGKSSPVPGETFAGESCHLGTASSGEGGGCSCGSPSDSGMFMWELLDPGQICLGPDCSQHQTCWRRV